MTGEQLLSDEVWERARRRSDLVDRGIDIVAGEVLEVLDELTGEPAGDDRVVIGFDGSKSSDHMIVTTFDGHLYRIDPQALDFNYPPTRT